MNIHQDELLGLLRSPNPLASLIILSISRRDVYKLVFRILEGFKVEVGEGCVALLLGLGT